MSAPLCGRCESSEQSKYPRGTIQREKLLVCMSEIVTPWGHTRIDMGLMPTSWNSTQDSVFGRFVFEQCLPGMLIAV